MSDEQNEDNESQEWHSSHFPIRYPITHPFPRLEWSKPKPLVELSEEDAKALLDKVLNAQLFKWQK
jgi:hypothetical protein